MAKKGYKRVYDIEQAEFVVRYFWNVKKDVEMVTTTTPVMDPYMGWGWGYGYGWGWGYGGGFATSTAPVTITEGTFILDLVDKDTKKLAWRATWVGEPRGRAPTQQELNDGAAGPDGEGAGGEREVGERSHRAGAPPRLRTAGPRRRSPPLPCPRRSAVRRPRRGRR
jgi:hypothetical protein